MMYLPIHFIWYFILEKTITTDYYSIHCALDNLIPFCEWFIFPYFSWFLYMIISGFYFLFNDEEAFEHYMLSLIIGFFISTTIISVFPNGQDLRPTVYNANFAAQIMKWTQQFDTNTNVFPSMHVVGAICVWFAIAKSETLRSKRWLQVCNWLLCTAIILATVFLKQHSVLDVFAGMVVAGIAAFFTYKGYAGELLTKFENLITKKRDE
jgi:PAP2 superfamily.